jgi:hypothetical protein
MNLDWTRPHVLRSGASCRLYEDGADTRNRQASPEANRPAARADVIGDGIAAKVAHACGRQSRCSWSWMAGSVC